MNFIYSLPAEAQIGVFLLFMYWGYVLWKNRKKAVKEFKESDITYSPDELSGEDLWRWSQAPEDVGLPVEQDDDQSTIHIQPKRSSNEIVFGLLGLGLAGLTAWLTVLILLRSRQEQFAPIGVICVMLAILAALSFALCSTDAPITTIIRKNDRLIFRLRFAAFFHRNVAFRAKIAKLIEFKGDIQSFLDMNTDQLDRDPDMNFFVRRRFRTSKRFLLRCTPTQGKWLIDGLNQWRTVAGQANQKNQ